MQHTQEQIKPTNSARLACRVLEQAQIIPWERKGAFPVPAGSILLYPSADATPLDSEDLIGSPTIAIADGTWPQASRIASVVGQGPVLKRALPLGNISAWTIRHCADPERISSAQAAAMVLVLAGEQAAAHEVMQALTESAKRILSMRGLVRHPPKNSPAGAPLRKPDELAEAKV